MKKRVYFLSLAIAGLLLVGCNKTNDLPPASESSIQTEASSEESAENASEEEIITYQLRKEDAVSDGGFYLRNMGFQEYASFEGETFTDTPAEGNKYLILYLGIANYGQDDYFNPDYFTATLDGTEIEHTYLMNDPDGYSTAFSKISMGEEFCGYIVWEVPENWENFSFRYSGWETTNHAVIEATYSKDDLSDPPENENELS